MPKTFLFIASIGGLLSVALGAFGAHVLEAVLTVRQLSTFETATHYLVTHSLALFLVGILNLLAPSSWFRWCGWLLILGCALFSGSLYLLVATQISFLGVITPIGGVTLLLAWLLLAIGALKLKLLAT